MKGRRASLAMAVCAFMCSLQARADSCSCSAPDNSCQIQISCSGGCSAICGTGSNCFSYCSDGSRIPFVRQGLESPQIPATDEERPDTQALPKSGPEPRLNLDLDSASPAEVSECLSAVAKVPVSFIPAQPDEPISMQVKNFPLSEFLAILAKQGAVVIDRRQIKDAQSRQKGVEAHISVDAHRLNAEALSRTLTNIMNMPVIFSSSSANALFDLQVKDISVQEFLKQIANLGEISFQEP